MRLIGVSVLQSAASAVLAPSLKHTSESLALAWRRRLTRIAHAQYLHGNTFYSASQLAGMQVRPHSSFLVKAVKVVSDDFYVRLPAFWHRPLPTPCARGIWVLPPSLSTSTASYSANTQRGM